MTFKVLIIDEHAEQNQSLDDLQARGFIVRSTNTGNGFNEKKRAFNPDVIVVDSPQSLNQKEHSYHSLRAATNAPILVLSVVDQPGIVEKTLDRGADEYLVKPVSPNLFAARITALARRTGLQHTNHPPAS